MGLEQTLQTDLIQAMKSKDALKTQTLRMVKAIIEKHKIDSGSESVTDETIQGIIQKQVKQRQESFESFQKGGRSDMADKEKSEMDLLESYLPKQLSDDELDRLVQESIKECGATQKSDMGKVMKTIMPKLQGRADGKRVNTFVMKYLK